MNRELYGVLIGLTTIAVSLLPLPLFTLGVGFLSLMIGRELSLSLGVDRLFPLTFFAPLLFFIHPAVGMLYTATLALIFGYRNWDLDTFFKTFFILIYTGFFPSSLLNLREESTYYLLVLLFVVWANDVFAYYVGKKFGKTPFFPKLSPNKTVAGFLGGLTAGTLLFTMLSKEPLLRSLLVGVVVLCSGVLGDYFKSFIKRQLGIKDFSDILGKHGGFVDRFDALLFSAPVFYWLMFRL